MMKNQFPQTKHEISVGQLCLVSTNLSTNFSTAAQVREMLHPDASYQLIPCVTEAFFGDPWQLVLDLLPHTQNVLIDICMPYYGVDGRSRAPCKARYLLMNKRVLGVRVATSRGWQRRCCVEAKLPAQIVKFYTESSRHKGSITGMCAVGEFYLNFHNTKIAMLFTSELAADPNLMDEYSRHGCAYFTIIDDTPHSTLSAANTHTRLLINKYRGSNYCIAYAGCKTSANPLQCYWANAFVMQGQRVREANMFAFEKYRNVRLDVVTDIEGDDGETKIAQLDMQGCRLRICRWAALPDESEQGGVSKFDMNISKSMLYLWFLYQSINNGLPFTVGVPFTENIMAMVCLLNDIRKLLRHHRINPAQLLQIYHFPLNAASKTQQRFWPDTLEICNQAVFCSLSEIVETANGGRVYFYCEMAEEVKFFRDQSRHNSNVYLCRELLVEKFMEEKKVDRTFLRTNYKLSQIIPERSVQKLCEEIVYKKYSNLSEMIRHFVSKNQNHDLLMKSFTQTIPWLIRTNMNLTCCHNYILACSKDKLKKEVGRIAIGLKQKQSAIIIDEESKESKSSLDLTTRLKQIKETKKAMQKQLMVCHCCSCIVRKSQCKVCEKCQNNICIECMADKFTNANAQLQQFESMVNNCCPFCNQTCRCKHCLAKVEAKQREEQERRKKLAQPCYVVASCFTCQLAGRKRKLIDIECYQCHEISCAECLKLQEGLNWKGYHDKWICKKCTKNAYIKQSAAQSTEMQKEREKQAHMQLLPHETVEGLNKLIEQEKMEMTGTSEDAKLIFARPPMKRTFSPEQHKIDGMPQQIVRPKKREKWFSRRNQQSNPRSRSRSSESESENSSSRSRSRSSPQSSSNRDHEQRSRNKYYPQPRRAYQKPINKKPYDPHKVHKQKLPERPKQLQYSVKKQSQPVPAGNSFSPLHKKVSQPPKSSSWGSSPQPRTSNLIFSKSVQSQQQQQYDY